MQQQQQHHLAFSISRKRTLFSTRYLQPPSQHPFPLLNLPVEMQRRVVSFLHAGDALHMSQSCKTLHSNLALSVLRPPLEIFETLGRRRGNETGEDVIYRAFRLPVYNNHVRAHCVRLDCFWQDQGWGDCKGEAWIVAFPYSPSTTQSSAVPDSCTDRFLKTGGRIVAHSVLDSHERLRLRMSFSPIQGNSYHFYYKVGSGGGHQLVFHTGQLHLLMYDDDQSRNVSRNYSVLLAGGALTTVKFHSDGIHHGAFTTISGAGEAASTLLLPRMLHVRY